MKIYTEEEKAASDSLKNWLNSHPLIHIAGLEVKCKIPFTTISGALGETRRIPPKHHEAIIEELKEYGYNPCVILSKK